MPTETELQQQIQRHERFLAVDPANAHLLATLGDLYHQAGRLEDAVRCLEQCIALDPQRPTLRSALANVLISQHRFADAEAQLGTLIESGVDDAAVWHNLGLATYFQHRFGEARELFARAQQRGLQAPGNFAYLARSLHQVGELDDAVVACQRWVALSDDLAGKSYLALLQADQGHLSQACEGARAVLALNPADANAHVVIGLGLMDEQDPATARPHFEQALRSDAGNGRAWLGLGLALLYDQQPSDAATALERAVTIFPDHPAVLVSLGWARLLARDNVAAKAAFERAVHMGGGDAESHAGLAAALAEMGELDAADEAIRRARQCDPASFGADISASMVLALRGDQQSAAEVFDQMLQRSPGPGSARLVDNVKRYLGTRRRQETPPQADPRPVNPSAG